MCNHILGSAPGAGGGRITSPEVIFRRLCTAMGRQTASDGNGLGSARSALLSLSFPAGLPEEQQQQSWGRAEAGTESAWTSHPPHSSRARRPGMSRETSAAHKSSPKEERQSTGFLVPDRTCLMPWIWSHWQGSLSGYPVKPILASLSKPLLLCFECYFHQLQESLSKGHSHNHIYFQKPCKESRISSAAAQGKTMEKRTVHC